MTPTCSKDTNECYYTLYGCMFAENLRHNYYWSSNAIRAIVLLQHYNYIGLKFQYNIGLLCVHN